MAATRSNRKPEAVAFTALCALLFALVVQAQQPASYFSASLTISTVYDSFEGRAGTTSTGSVYYDYTIPAVRFDARTTPDRAGDDPNWVNIWITGTKYTLLKERGGVQCIREVGPAMQQFVCPSYSCGSYCRTDCSDFYDCYSYSTTYTRRTCTYNGDYTLASMSFDEGYWSYSSYSGPYWTSQRRTSWTFSGYNGARPSSSVFNTNVTCPLGSTATDSV